MVPTINEEFTLCIWNSMLIKLRLQCIGNVCCVLVYSQSVYSTQLCVHTEQWIHNFGLTSVLAQRLAVWSTPPGGLIFGSHGRPRYTRIRVITRRVITRADCTLYIIGWTGCYTDNSTVRYFHNCVSKCYVVYLRHTVFDSV